ncbi:MAG: Hpt domain-containing protein, partial [Bdellovibrionales bacterium]|nr:Hpt domain-containing protein [Bdellovibrionales bacterium]
MGEELTKVFAKDDAINRVEGDLDLLFELMQMLWEQYPTSVAELRAAVESKNGQKLRESAHSIKSALGNLGAMTSFELAFELEKRGRDENFSDL